MLSNQTDISQKQLFPNALFIIYNPVTQVCGTDYSVSACYGMVGPAWLGFSTSQCHFGWQVIRIIDGKLESWANTRRWYIAAICDDTFLDPF